MADRIFCSDCRLVIVDAPGGRCGYCKYASSEYMAEREYSTSCIECHVPVVYNWKSRHSNERFYCGDCLGEMFPEEYEFGPATMDPADPGDYCSECYFELAEPGSPLCEVCIKYPGTGKSASKMNADEYYWYTGRSFEQEADLTVPALVDEMQTLKAVR